MPAMTYVSRPRALRARIAGLLVMGTVLMPASQAQTAAPGTPQAQPAARVAVVNGQTIGVPAFELALQQQLMSGASDSAALREAVRRDLVIQLVLAQEAQRAKLDQAGDFSLRLEAARQRLLAEAWQAHWLQANPPTDQELADEYQATLKRAGSKQYRIRQVVLQDETAARLVYQQIRQGKSLADMAREYSVEPLGKSEGGLLPWVTVADLVEPLGQVVAGLKTGQAVSEPVRSGNGWHILQLEAERPYVPPTAVQLRPQLIQAVSRRKLSAAAQSLVDKARIEIR